MSQTTLQKHISRLMALLLSILLFLPCIPVAQADGESGTCGDDLTWSLNAGTLTVAGSGSMTNFTEETFAPWYALREEILRVDLPSGLTNIGDLAFYGCKNMVAVSIPDSVRRIGYYSFGNCTSLQMVNLGYGMEIIGEGAFTECRNLTSLRLPITIASIGTKAFYRCESLTSVTIPQFVVSVGAAAFGYCTGLVTADIQAPLNYLPDFLFYGCTRLSSVTVAKKPEIVSQYAFEGCVNLAETIEGSKESTSTTGSFSQNNSDGSTTHENVTVTQKDNVTVTSKVENTQQPGQTGGTHGAEIDVTVENEEGWKEAINQVDKELNDYQNTVENTGGESDKVQVNVYIKNETEVNSDFVEHFADKDVQINVMTEEGSSWRIHENVMKSEEFSGNYDMAYTLTKGGEDLNRELNVSDSFCLRFRTSAEVNAEVLIHLGTTWAQMKATLFQRNGIELEEIQTVVVDREGYAHFYLAAVDKDTEYYVGINVPDPKNEAIIPENLYDEYTLIDSSTGKPYVITGRKSSWNMGLGKVMAILAVVMVSAIVVVGAVMFFWNKQRLKAGYVPQWDDEDEDT